MYDVAVVGGGPAGATAALHLARGGAKVILIEKMSLPRYKTCGGGIAYRARKLLNLDISSVVEIEFNRAAITLLNSGLSFKTQRDHPVISMTMRASFDNLLVSVAEGAGVRLMTKTKVCALSNRDGHVELETSAGSVKAHFIIAADGAHSMVAKFAGWKDHRYLIPAIESELYVLDKDMARFEKTARFDFDIPPHGYAWLFPKKDHLSVGILSVKRDHVSLKTMYENYLRALKIVHIVHEERHGYVIPISPRDDGFSRHRILLVGDAAGFADPVTAEGISYAIQSGLFATSALLEGNLDPAQTVSRYRQLVSKFILPELSKARILAKVLYGSPALRTWIFRRYGEKLTNAISKIFTGEKTYTQIVSNPRNYLKLCISPFQTVKK